MGGAHCKETLGGVGTSMGQVGLPFSLGIKAPQAGRSSGGGVAISHGKGEPFLSPTGLGMGER